MYAYCNCNPVLFRDDNGTRPVITGSLGTEKELENKSSFNYMNNLPAPIAYMGKTSSGKHVFVYDEPVKVYNSKTISVYDNRSNVDINNMPNPNIQVAFSHRVTSSNEQKKIIGFISVYNFKYPSKHPWNRTFDSLYIEWQAHNDIYTFLPNERCRHVDFDNNAEGKSYRWY